MSADVAPLPGGWRVVFLNNSDGCALLAARRRNNRAVDFYVWLLFSIFATNRL